jgi:hypothetical protein
VSVCPGGSARSRERPSAARPGFPRRRSATVCERHFWFFVVYSGQHRGLLETDQKGAGVDSLSPDLKANPDGSCTVWFAPTAPSGKEGNWVQTMPDKSWSVLVRLYGPLEPWFDKSWKPGDIELVT